MKNLFKSIILSIFSISMLVSKDGIGYVDFDTSMKWPQNNDFKRRPQGTKASDIRKIVDSFRELYNKNCSLMSNPRKDPLIPKIIHQIWIGPNMPPAILADSQESIKRLHPDWEYKLWTDADVPSFKLFNQKQFDESKNWGERADIFRYEILYRYGGTYLDVDVICLKSFDILQHSFDFYAGIQSPDVIGLLGNTIIGSKPGHPIIKRCVEGLSETWDKYTEKMQKNTHMRVVYRSGPNHFQESFLFAAKDNVEHSIVFPASYFYPLNFRDAHKVTPETIADIIKPESFAIHYWAKTWHKAKGAVK